MFQALLFLCTVGALQAVPVHDDTRTEERCGYESCTKSKDGFLNVHIVPHTHDDVGWLKTVDQYYYGSRNNIQKAGVQYILDSVVKELWEDPKRRFIYVETAFFWKWWVRQSEAVQQKVHTLVREGRLQFVGGAWSMNDEAAAHYHSTIDQFTWGLSKLNQTFGKCGLPRVGWQIDPFGHSREFASLLAAMGYDGLFLGRIDYQDKKDRLANKNMEMVWRGDDALGKSSDIFTGILYNTYSPPPGFCFDVLCDDEPIIDDPASPMYNVDSKISLFIDYVKNQSECYRTNNVVVTMGGDFTYQDATMWYTNLDKLIKYTNLKSAKDNLNITLFYSTPTCYLNAVKDANPTLPTKKDDFFPYASDPTAYWTGYFTSRPTTKYFERHANILLQMVKQLQVLAELDDHNEFVLNELKSAMGIMQHHDAITGTEKEHVTHDYERILTQAVDDAMIIARQGINKMFEGNNDKAPILGLNLCKLNESSCDISENSDQFVVTIYNPLAWQVNSPISVPVMDGSYDVFAPNHDKIQHELYKIPEPVKAIPTRKSSATHEIVFIAYLKPVSYKSFYIQKHTRSKRDSNNNNYNKINEYWKNIKENMIDVKDISFDINKELSKEKSFEMNTGVKYDISYEIPSYKTVVPGDEDIINDYTLIINKNDKVPLEPVQYKPTEYKQFNIDVLRGQNDGNLKDLEEFLRENEKSVDRGGRRMGIGYPELNDDEMRMLGDDPMIVQIFDDEPVMKNKLRYTLNEESNGIKPTEAGEGISLNISMYYYTGATGNNENYTQRASGAYIFRPRETNPKKLSEIDRKFISNDLFDEQQVKLSDNAYYTVRLYKTLKEFYINWVVGPISIEDDIGKEYIIKYESNVLNNGEFYTDSNGRQVLKRKLNYRPQWNVTLEEPIAGNYYPVTNEIYIKNDLGNKITVITDRSQGGTSLVEGDVELMLHRRLLCDDAFGVGEALNETAMNVGLVVRGTHKLIISGSDNIDNRKQVLETQLSPNVMFSDAKGISFDDWKTMVNGYSFVNELPDGVHLLTLEPWGDKLLLRLENYLDDSESSDVEVDLTKVLKHITIKGVKEAVLSANQWVEEHRRMVWNTESDGNDRNDGNDRTNDGNDRKNDANDVFDINKVKFTANQIRTFIIDYDFNPK